MILELLNEGRTEQEVKRILVQSLGMDEVTAQFAIDIELGRQGGDHIRVNQDGTEAAVDSLTVG